MRDKIKMRFAVMKWLAANWLRQKWDVMREHR
jgi:hypothetical protein